ncbi:MAG TPA: hypothetical protein PKE51_11975, partial [Gemmatimonadaceae bacterium]|nr:hypothetical protein [Gemmatimonadaceae bacterium]
MTTADAARASDASSTSPEDEAPSRAIAWVGPFALFMLLLAVMPRLPIAQPWESIVRVALITGSLWVWSRDVLRPLRVQHVLRSIGVGALVFGVWVAPDLLVPGWRSHWLLQNA